MMKLPYLAFAFVLIIAGCASRDYEPWLTRGINTVPSESRDEFALARTACFGVCPVYDVTVDDQDYLQFRGKQFVAEEGGSISKRLPAGSYKKLIAIAASHNFNQFDNAYPNADASNCPQTITDAPSILVGFSKGEKTENIRVYGGCIGFDGQQRFAAMITAMDAVLDIEEFVGPRDAFEFTKE